MFWDEFSLEVPKLNINLDGSGPAVPGVVSEEAFDQAVVEDGAALQRTQDSHSSVSGPTLSNA